MSPKTASRSERLEIRAAVKDLCARFPDSYWRASDAEEAYPTEFIDELTRGGWLSILIPETYGGAGLGVSEAALVLEEINRSGGNAAAAHAQIYLMGTLLRHGSDAQRSEYLPAIASGDQRLQAFAVTEPNAGSETTRIETSALRQGDQYVVTGQKVFTSRLEHSDLMLLLARTTPYEDLADKTRGLSLFIVDLRVGLESGAIQVRPLKMMLNHHTVEVFIDNLVVGADKLVGRKGEGFRYILDGWNAERILIAAECVGDGYWFIERAARYAQNRVVFGRPIGVNQGIQFPLANAYARVRAAELMTYHAAELFDQGESCGAEANMAKLLASQASWAAANACMDTHGGYGLAREFDIERKFRETRLYAIAPVSNNLILAYLGHNVLGMPKSY